ncbi:MAG: oxidoreductase [Bacillaceae bacterium]|nr:MAG: oxidoreductase [Bacillaceae bacterium]
MKRSFEGKSVIVIGASGGLGSSFAKAFADKGARLLLVGRNEEKVKKTAEQITGDITTAVFDITDLQSIEELKDIVKRWSAHIDIVVNASGYDVRKSLAEHSYEEAKNTLDINLLGAILITKAFLPHMREQKGSTIVHIGGFADGRLAFPYYSVDAASRAGLFTFIEAVNRELELEGSQARVAYFSPSPADTEAERPFHPLWRKMGVSIMPVEKVAEDLLKTIEKKKTVRIMGGMSTILFAKLNSISPKLADAIMMRKYGKMLQQFFYRTEDGGQQKPSRHKRGYLRKIAVILIIASFILYGLAAVVPLLPLTLTQIAAAVPALIAIGEIVWWAGLAIAGREVAAKYKKYLNPCTWFSCKRKTI